MQENPLEAQGDRIRYRDTKRSWENREIWDERYKGDSWEV
jgi:hypothetical protein